MRIPEQYHYTSEHQWASRVRASWRIGLTDFAQGRIGSIVFVDLAPVGMVVQAGESFGLVETAKVAVELLAPLAGCVAAINLHLQQQPHLINDDPYGTGWLTEIQPSSDRAAVLWTAAQYRDLIERLGPSSVSSVPPRRR